MKTPAPKSIAKVIDRYGLNKASSWLPAVALFLCLALFAMAAMVLFNAGAEPETPQGASVTSVAAHGFQGLKRILAARGANVEVNRFRDGPNAVHGDLEIVTLDVSGSMPTDLAAAMSSASASADSASADNDGGNDDAQGPAAEQTSQAANDDDEDDSSSASTTGVDDGFVPYPEESDHLLYKQLGHALLVVAPKWTANYYAQNARWAADPQLTSDSDIRDMLGELSPETIVPSPKDKDGKFKPPAAAEGQGVFFRGATSVIYDDVPYVIGHGKDASNLVIHRADGSATMAVGKIASLQSISGPNLTPVLLGPNGEVLMSRVNVTGGRKPTAVPVYLLSDPDLLDNQILSDPQKVIAALNIIDSVTPATTPGPAARRAPGSTPPNGRTTIVFNVTFNGLAFDHDLLHALSRPPFVAVPLSLLILGLGLMWAAFARFGPARHVAVEPPLGRGVRILADNAARLMSLTIREAKLAPAYATLMRDLVLKSRGYMQPSPAQTLDDLADRIGSMCHTTHSFADLKLQAAQVATVHQLIDLTLKLHAWKTEIQRAHI